MNRNIVIKDEDDAEKLLVAHFKDNIAFKNDFRSNFADKCSIEYEEVVELLKR